MSIAPLGCVPHMLDAISRPDFAAAGVRGRLRPRAFRIPVPPIAYRLLAIQACVLAVSAVLFRVTGLSIAWRTALAPAAMLAVLLGVWAWYATAPSRRDRAFVADTLLATFLLVLFTNIGGPAQYAGVALGLPLVDPWLAAADASLGIHVPALAAWTGGHPVLTLALVASYFTLLPQFVLPLVVLGLAYRDRDALWEYVFHFHVCLTVTLAGVALLPAACAFSHYGFTSLIDQTRFIHHFEGLRGGTLTEIRFDDIEGLISFPSFHVAGGLMVTWAFRTYRRWLAALVALNTMLIAATVLTGAHYGIDLVFTIALFGGSVVLWRARGEQSPRGERRAQGRSPREQSPPGEQRPQGRSPREQSPRRRFSAEHAEDAEIDLPAKTLGGSRAERAESAETVSAERAEDVEIDA